MRQNSRPGPLSKIWEVVFQFITKTAQLPSQQFHGEAGWHFLHNRMFRIRTGSVLIGELCDIFLKRQHTKRHLFDWRGRVLLSIVIGSSLHFVSATYTLNNNFLRQKGFATELKLFIFIISEHVLLEFQFSNSNDAHFNDTHSS